MITDRCPTCGSYQYTGPLPGRAWGEGLTEEEKQAVQAAYDAAPAQWKEFHCNDPWHEKMSANSTGVD